MKFIVHSRAVMQTVTPPNQTWGLISICEKGDFPEVQMNDFHAGRLNLQFHDTDSSRDGEILFDEAMAQRVVEWVLTLRERNVELIYVHCLMGQSRSAAVAAALDKALNGDDMRYFSNGLYKPNMLVYRTILDECHRQGLIG